jgi:GT2 family glycosyltransferase
MTLALIIATADRPEALATTLRGLTACELPERVLHVVVADNGTDAGTRRVCREAYPGLRVEHLRVSRRGKTIAQNQAVQAASADLLAFTDDDVEFDARWLVELYRAAHDWPDHLLFGGRVTPIWPESYPEHLEGSAYLGLLFTRLDLGEEVEEGPRPAFRPLGPNMAVRRKAFELGIRFDESIGPGSEGLPMGDELDITFQLEALGRPAVYVPASHVYHRVRENQLSLRWQLRRALNYGRMLAYFDGSSSGASLLGIPRWILRAIPERCASAAWNLVRGRRRAAFDKLMTAAFALGTATADGRTRRPGTPQGGEARRQGARPAETEGKP